MISLFIFHIFHFPIKYCLRYFSCSIYCLCFFLSSCSRTQNDVQFCFKVLLIFTCLHHRRFSFSKQGRIFQSLTDFYNLWLLDTLLAMNISFYLFFLHAILKHIKIYKKLQNYVCTWIFKPHTFLLFNL